MKISMNTVTFNRCKVKRANKRVSERDTRHLGLQWCSFLLLCSTWIKNTGLQSERDSQRPEGPPLVSLKVAGLTSCKRGKMSTLGCPAGPKSKHLTPESLMPAPVRESGLVQASSSLKPTATCHWVYRRPQTGQSWGKQRVHSGFITLLCSLVAPDLKLLHLGPKNCLHDFWTSLTPQGIWSFRLDH